MRNIHTLRVNISVNHPVQNPSVFVFLLTPMLSLLLLRNQIQHEAQLVLAEHQPTTLPAVYSVTQNNLSGIYKPHNHEKRQVLI
jgi:hypothetical protein